MTVDILPLLEDLGIQGLRAGEREISGLCPAHLARTGHNDSHPSWSINRSTGAHICFSCGWSGGLASVYAAVGQQAPPDLDLELLKSAVKAGIGAADAYAYQPPEVFNQLNPLVMDLFWLRAFDQVPENLLAMKYLTPEAANLYDVHWDSENNQWVIPIKTPRGELLGVQYRSPASTPINYPTGVDKSSTLFGLFELPPNTPAVLVVESPLDVVRCWTAGVPAVATFGVYISKEQISLLVRHFTYVVVGFDNPRIDKAGAKGSKQLSQSLFNLGCPTFQFNYDGLIDSSGNLAKDPGDVADSYSLHQAWVASQRLHAVV